MPPLNMLQQLLEVFDFNIKQTIEKMLKDENANQKLLKILILH